MTINESNKQDSLEATAKLAQTLSEMFGVTADPQQVALALEQSGLRLVEDTEPSRPAGVLDRQFAH